MLMRVSRESSLLPPKNSLVIMTSIASNGEDAVIWSGQGKQTVPFCFLKPVKLHTEQRNYSTGVLLYEHNFGTVCTNETGISVIDAMETMKSQIEPSVGNVLDNVHVVSFTDPFFLASDGNLYHRVLVRFVKDEYTVNVGDTVCFKSPQSAIAATTATTAMTPMTPMTFTVVAICGECAKLAFGDVEFYCPLNFLKPHKEPCQKLKESLDSDDVVDAVEAVAMDVVRRNMWTVLDMRIFFCQVVMAKLCFVATNEIPQVGDEFWCEDSQRRGIVHEVSTRFLMIKFGDFVEAFCFSRDLA